MKTFSAIFSTSAAAFAVLSGCSSAAMNAPLSTPAHDAAPAKYAGVKDLYVADYDTGTVFRFKNDRYTPDGTIASGISGPWDVTLDRSGNLYVANAAGANITEYAPGASTPSFTYSYGMTSPRLLSVDRHGNLFETDFTGYDGNGTVSEYPQGTNYPLYSCPVTGPWGVTTDSLGDVFVDGNIIHGGGGYIEEFKGGLAGCSPKMLGAKVESATGIAIDRGDNLLVADSNAGRIDVIPPPYSSISRHLSTGRWDPSFIAIDSTNGKVFASASGFYHSYVVTVNYATGKLEHQLGYARGGFGSPYGVVDAPNAVP